MARSASVKGTPYSVPGMKGKRVALILEIQGDGSTDEDARKDAHNIATAIGGKRKLKVQESDENPRAVIVTNIKATDAAKFLIDATLVIDANPAGSDSSPAL